MKDFTRGISNHTGPDPNRLFNGYASTSSGGGKSKEKKKGEKKKKPKKPKVGVHPGQEEALPFANDVLKFIQKRLKPGAGVVIAAGISPEGLPIIKVGIGKVEDVTMACEFHSDNPFLDLEVCMPQARFVMGISSDNEQGKS
nr:MAG TPA: hypothetical protein [Caudoviricetes sp.]